MGERGRVSPGTNSFLIGLRGTRRFCFVLVQVEMLQWTPQLRVGESIRQGTDSRQ